jgi:beta-phosphoglucomutase-like phosphatase (HAD superfamily)
MPKVDALLNIVQAAMTFSNDARVNSMYAQLAANRNQLQSLLEGIPDAADQLANQAVGFAVGSAGKPNWIEAIGL